MNIRLENINTETSSAYVSFLSKPRRSKGSDRDSIHSVSSVRSVMSTMSSFWSSFGLASKESVSKSEKAKAALETDLKYLYSAFTKIPCLRLAPDHRARLIQGFEEFPFDTAVPLHSFKNLSALEIIDVDFRSFFGWDRLAEQLRSLTLKRANVEDIGDLLAGIVLDDIDKRRRRSSKSQPSPILGYGSGANSTTGSEAMKSVSAPGSPVVDPAFGTSSSPKGSVPMMRGGSEGAGKAYVRAGSISPTRPASYKGSHHRHIRGTSSKIRRSGSGSSNSSETSTVYRNRSMSNLLATGALPSTKWRFLRHLSLTDNSLTSISTGSLAPVANSLHSFDLSSNLFTEVPDSLASLVALRSLNLSYCMIGSLHSLSRSPLPAITALNLRGNRLRSIAGIERLLSLERLDLRENHIPDPTEIARLTAIPYIREVWVAGNPFTKSHTNYRVTIFNLFRRTPGYSEDIQIDGTGPSYTERKQLVERVAEPEVAPVIRPSELEDNLKNAQDESLDKSPEEVTPAKPIALSHSQREHHPGSTRRKRAQRRRIIDLSHDDPPTLQESVDNEVARPFVKNPPPDPFIEASPKDTRHNTNMQPQHDFSQTNAAPVSFESPKALEKNDSKNKNLLPAIEGIDWNGGGDIYRQRLEALKHEVGTNWLTVLGDEAWANKQSNLGMHTSTDFHPAVPIRPPPASRTSSQVVATGGRTLG